MATFVPPEFYFAAALRRARSEAELNQEGLALKIGMHASDISVIESGRRSPRLKTIKRLADGLGIHYWHLAWLAAQLESGAKWADINWPPSE